jgi:hypothetical protein
MVYIMAMGCMSCYSRHKFISLAQPMLTQPALKIVVKYMCEKIAWKSKRLVHFGVPVFDNMWDLGSGEARDWRIGNTLPVPKVWLGVTHDISF